MKRVISVDPDTLKMDPSSSSTDLDPATATDVDSSSDQMDDTSLRSLATSHPLKPEAPENVSKKARNARNLLQSRGAYELKFDVNEKALLNADLISRSDHGGALLDGLPTDKVKAGDDREITQMKDLQLYSWVEGTDVPPGKSILLTGCARRMKGNEVRSRCVKKHLETTVRDDVFAPTASPESGCT